MLETLRNIVQEVNAAGGVNEALQIIVRRVRDAMSTQVCSVYMRDPASGRYVFRATEGLNQELVGVASLAAGDGLVGLVAERGEPVNLEDAENHPSFRFLPGIGEEHFHAFLGVPIIHQRGVLGVLVVQQAERRRFDESDEAFLVTLSAQLAGVIAHAQVTGALDAQALTGAAPAKITGVPGAPGSCDRNCRGGVAGGGSVRGAGARGAGPAQGSARLPGGTAQRAKGYQAGCR